ncbi:MAG: FG-GAP-like repeat-containing protein [Planctomycetota bacterium]|nr:FG-GAP-like repeat-containing protein [Planctomycetota bacterium]
MSAVIAGCGSEVPSVGELNTETQLAREQAAVFFADEKLDRARDVLSPLVSRRVVPEDSLRMGVLELASSNTESARTHLENAAKGMDASAGLEYNLGRLAVHDGNYELAVKHFSLARQLDSEDVPSLFQLAVAKSTLGDPQAADLFQELLSLGIENTNSWHLAALYRLSRFQLEGGESAKSRETLKEFSRLQATGMVALTASQLDQGNYGKLEMPNPIRFEEKQPVLVSFLPARSIFEIGSSVDGEIDRHSIDLVDDWVLPENKEGAPISIGDGNTLIWGASGIINRSESGSEVQLWAEPVSELSGFDLDKDGELDFVVTQGSEVILLQQENGVLFKKELQLPTLPSPPHDLLLADEDHEGDLDLLLVGDFGARIWRNDGLSQDGAFTDISEAAGLSGLANLSWCLAEDLDTDQDVDFLVGGNNSVAVLSNLRGGKFELLTPPFANTSSPEEPKLGDFNGDGRPDIQFSDSSLWFGVPGGGFTEAELPQGLIQQPEEFETSLTLALRGTTDNRRAVGAIAEYRAAGHYGRCFWSGEPMLMDLRGHHQADWVKITWPNGVTQFEVNVPKDQLLLLVQKEGLAGSCPFLYTWNGETYEFISDVIGATPLGLPIAEGFFVPPDHDEFVLVSGEQLVERNGTLDIQITEELREVTYLDRVRLDVLDHPEFSEVFPNERFKFPPFPVAHNHSVVNPLSPVSARGSDGEDWTQALQQIDLDFAVPFEPYQSTVETNQPWGGQFLGLAPQHSLVIEFSGEEIAQAEKLRLLMTGWFYWSVASVNMASSRTPGIDFVPPLLEVPDGKGGWKSSEHTIGFPAGKLKTMVIDVSDFLVRDDPRIRLSSTLRLYWDAIRLATDSDDAPIRVTSLAPMKADLWQRGFSKPVELEKSAELLLEWFQWEELEPYPRWNQHPGVYTKLGDVRPLLEEAEDQFIVMGSGDAVDIRFDATLLPPIPQGWKRDYLVYLDGWAKDRDHSCVNVEFTEPFPFHAMSGFPYGEDESFPDDEAHLQWRKEWLTRPAKRWIPELTSMK